MLFKWLQIVLFRINIQMIDLNATHLILISCDLPICLSTLEHINLVIELAIAKDIFCKHPSITIYIYAMRRVCMATQKIQLASYHITMCTWSVQLIYD